MWGVKSASDQLKEIRKMFWSGRPDLNRRPPAPKAGVLPLGSPSFSIFLLKRKGLTEAFGSGTMYGHVLPHA
jgi:hypothetical protein